MMEIKEALKIIEKSNLRLFLCQDVGCWSAMALGPMEDDKKQKFAAYTRGFGKGKTYQEALADLIKDLTKKKQIVKSPNREKPEVDFWDET